MSTYIILVCRIFIKYIPCHAMHICMDIWCIHIVERQYPSSDILKWFRCVILCLELHDQTIVICWNVFISRNDKRRITHTTHTQWQRFGKHQKALSVRAPSPAIYCLRSIRWACGCCCCVQYNTIPIRLCWKTLHAVIHFARFWLLMLLQYSVCARACSYTASRIHWRAKIAHTSIRKFYGSNLYLRWYHLYIYRTCKCRYTCVLV